MKAQTALPQALYRTNLQLQARLAALLQDTARQWLDFWQRLVEEGVAIALPALAGARRQHHLRRLHPTVFEQHAETTAEA